MCLGCRWSHMGGRRWNVGRVPAPCVGGVGMAGWAFRGSGFGVVSVFIELRYVVLYTCFQLIDYTP